jgi:hypothetical protein
VLVQAGLGELHPQGGLEDLVPGGLQGGVLGGAPGAGGNEPLPAPPSPVGLGPGHPLGDLAHLLVLEEAPDQLRPGVLVVVGLGPGEEELRLDPDEGGGHLQELARLVQFAGPDSPDRLQKLGRDQGNGDIEDVDILLPDQVEKEVQGAVEALDFHQVAALLPLEKGHPAARGAVGCGKGAGEAFGCAFHGMRRYRREGGEATPGPHSGADRLNGPRRATIFVDSGSSGSPRGARDEGTVTGTVVECRTSRVPRSGWS